MNIILYGTLGCHLCDLAESMLSDLDIEYEGIDIMDDPNLIKKFGCSIPVLQKSVISEELLFWPFSKEDIVVFTNNKL